MEQHAVVVFDGECSFCNGWVDFLMRVDKKDVFRFAARQSESGAAYLVRSGLPADGVGSIIVVHEGRILLHSDAVLTIMGLLGLPFSAMTVFRLVPRPIRDAVYEFVARNRTRLFGRKIACRIPSAAERHRFI